MPLDGTVAPSVPPPLTQPTPGANGSDLPGNRPKVPVPDGSERSLVGPSGEERRLRPTELTSLAAAGNLVLRECPLASRVARGATGWCGRWGGRGGPCRR